MGIKVPEAKGNSLADKYAKAAVCKSVPIPSPSDKMLNIFSSPLDLITEEIKISQFKAPEDEKARWKHGGLLNPAWQTLEMPRRPLALCSVTPLILSLHETTPNGRDKLKHLGHRHSHLEQVVSPCPICQRHNPGTDPKFSSQRVADLPLPQTHLQLDASYLKIHIPRPIHENSRTPACSQTD